MLIKFKNISIEGFQSIGNAYVELNDRGFTLVNGINNCAEDNAQSNGAGKTTIFSAICFAITGETLNGNSKNLVNINTDTGLCVKLCFSVDENNYEIIRTKEHKEYGTSLKLIVNGEDKSGKGIRDTEKTIQECLPELTSELLGSVIIIGQGMPQRFTGNNPSGRKEVLEKLSKSDFMIEDIKNRLSDRKTKLSSEIKDMDLKINTLQGKLSVYLDNQKSLEEQLNSMIPPNEEEITEGESKLKSVREKISEFSEKIKEVEKEVSESTQKQIHYKEQQSSEEKNIDDSFFNDLQNKTENKYKLSSEISSIEAEIKKLDSIKDICPTCGQKLPNVHKVDTTIRKEELCRLKNELNAVLEEIKKIDEDKRSCKRAIESKYATYLLEELNKRSALSTKLSGLKSSISEYTNEENRLVSFLTEKNIIKKTFFSKKVEIENKLLFTKKEIEKINEELVYNNVERNNTCDRLDAVNKMSTIATRDFRGFLLTNVINFINSRAKSYCYDIFGTEEISLYLEGNNLNVSYCNKMYENLSGGEQKKVDIILQLSIRDMLCKFSSFSSNILVLDETFEALDYLGCQKVVDVITKRLSDIESVFIITHRSNLSLPADSTLTVVKDENGISSVV